MLQNHAFPDMPRVIEEGLTYWEKSKNGKPLPSWQDINPAEIKHLLPSVVVAHVSYNPLDFIERITGERILEHSNGNSMGRNWRDFPGRGPGSKIWSVFENTVNSRQPSYNVVPYVGPHNEFLKVVAITCPISSDGEKIDRLISFVDYISQTDNELELDVEKMISRNNQATSQPL